jgi:hypothetical protein
MPNYAALLRGLKSRLCPLRPLDQGANVGQDNVAITSWKAACHQFITDDPNERHHSVCILLCPLRALDQDEIRFGDYVPREQFRDDVPRERDAVERLALRGQMPVADSDNFVIGHGFPLPVPSVYIGAFPRRPRRWCQSWRAPKMLAHVSATSAAIRSILRPPSARSCCAATWLVAHFLEAL